MRRSRVDSAASPVLISTKTIRRSSTFVQSVENDEIHGPANELRVLGIELERREVGGELLEYLPARHRSAPADGVSAEVPRAQRMAEGGVQQRQRGADHRSDQQTRDQVRHVWLRVEAAVRRCPANGLRTGPPGKIAPDKIESGMHRTSSIAWAAVIAAAVTSTAAVRQSPVQAASSSTDGDTAHARLIPGRKKHDSVAFASTVAFGRHQMAKTGRRRPRRSPGSILPANRVVAFYGNPLSKRMGVLGEYPTEQMLAKLDDAVREWQRADPTTPVKPALQLIAVVAQGSPGRDGMYRLRMDSALIEKVYGWAKQRNALLFLDIQVAKSTMQRELPRLMPFLSRPDVHSAMDAEFSMHYSKEGMAPGKKVGQFDAKDVNWVSEQLRAARDREEPAARRSSSCIAGLKPMISNADKITLDPRVQVVMDMDGWGPPWMKFESYRDYIDLEPVEYTGFKIFFHNDVKHHDPLLTPARSSVAPAAAALHPVPVTLARGQGPSASSRSGSFARAFTRPSRPGSSARPVQYCRYSRAVLPRLALQTPGRLGAGSGNGDWWESVAIAREVLRLR